MTDTNFEATVMIPTDHFKEIDRNFDWPEWLSVYPSTAFFETDDPNQWKMSIYMNEKPNQNDVEIMGKALRDFTGMDINNPEFSRLENQDWVSKSQKLHKPVIAGRFVAFGEHDKDKVDADKIHLQIEGRQAFGTGSHSTTKGCLLAIDQLADEFANDGEGDNAPVSILDVGTGSGILAMAMARVWDVPVLASDNDPVAIDAARDILEINNTNFAKSAGEVGITLAVSEWFADPVFNKAGPFNLITANILGIPLIENAADIVNQLAEGGVIILAGLLERQEDAVRCAFEAQGLTLKSRAQINEWPTLVMTKS